MKGKHYIHRVVALMAWPFNDIFIIKYLRVKMRNVFEKYLSNTPKYANQIQIQIQIFAYLNTNTHLTPALDENLRLQPPSTSQAKEAPSMPL